MTLDDNLMDDGRNIDMPEFVEQIDPGVDKKAVELMLSIYHEFDQSNNNIYGDSNRYHISDGEWLVFRRYEEARPKIPLQPSTVSAVFQELCSDMTSAKAKNVSAVGFFTDTMIRLSYKGGYDRFTLIGPERVNVPLFYKLRGFADRPISINYIGYLGFDSLKECRYIDATLISEDYPEHLDTIGQSMRHSSVQIYMPLSAHSFQHTFNCKFLHTDSLLRSAFNYSVLADIIVGKDFDSLLVGLYNSNVKVLGDVRSRKLMHKCKETTAKIMGSCPTVPSACGFGCKVEVHGKVGDAKTSPNDFDRTEYRVHDNISYNRLAKLGLHTMLVSEEGIVIKSSNTRRMGHDSDVA